MKQNQQKNSGNKNNQSRSTPPRINGAETAQDPMHKQIAEISEIEFRIWIANKIKLEFQKLSQEFNGYKDQMTKDFDTWRQEVAALKDLRNTVESFSNRMEQAEERISDIEDKAFECS